MTNRNRVQVPRRRRVWAYQKSGFTITAGTLTHRELLSDYRAARGITANEPGTTVGRIRGKIKVLGAAPFDEINIPYGALISELVQQPTADPFVTNVDWMLLGSMFGDTGGGEFAAGSFSSGFKSFDIETKAQRKMEEVGESVWLALHNDGDVTVSIDLHMGILLLLP